MTTDLPVPLAAIDALEAADLTYTDTTPETEVRAVAAPVVVADYRWLAAEARAAHTRMQMPENRELLELVARVLEARADELETR